MISKLRINVTDQDGVLLDSTEIDLAEVEAHLTKDSRALMMASNEVEGMIYAELYAALKRYQEQTPTEKDLIEKLWAYRKMVLGMIEACDDGIHEVLRTSVEDDAIDRTAITCIVEEKVKASWSFADILAYGKCLEHVDPRMSEERALEKMSQISSKYPKVK